MNALESSLAEIRASAADGSTAALLTEECGALWLYIAGLQAAVLMAEQGHEGWPSVIADAAAEIRDLETA